MPAALEAVFPRNTLQTCIVHLIRNSLDYAIWKDRKAMRPIYAAASAEAAEVALDAFAEGEWGRKFPTVVAAWRRAWAQVIPFFAFPPEIRRVIYTTDALDKRRVESVQRFRLPDCVMPQCSPLVIAHGSAWVFPTTR
jgi:putative transposase